MKKLLNFALGAAFLLVAAPLHAAPATNMKIEIGGVTLSQGKGVAPKIAPRNMVRIGAASAEASRAMSLHDGTLRADNTTLLTNISDDLQIEGGGAWRAIKSDASTRIMENADGVTWTRTLRRESSGALTLQNTIEVPASTRIGAASDAKTWRYHFAAKAGEVAFSRYAFNDVQPKYFDAKPATFNIGATTPYLVFESVSGLRFAARYSDPLDSSGTFQTFSESGDLMRWDLTKQKSPLRAGAKISFGFTFAAFDGAPTDDLARRDYPRIASLERAQMLTANAPLPQKITPKIGHIFTARWSQLRDEKLLQQLADAGTKIITIQGDDYQDIGQGVSGSGDYDAAPEDMTRVLARIHALGMKAIWWFSIKGVLRAGSERNGGKGSPLLAEHPDWFTGGTYWDGRYQGAEMFSADWKNWILAKLRRDLTRFPIDGFGFDEPYFVGVNTLDKDGTTYARNGYDFLSQISSTIKSFGAGKIVLTNYWTPVSDEWKFFDFMMTENSSLAYLTDVTLGKHGAGHPGGQTDDDSKLFTWSLTFNHLIYNFGDFDQVLGWSHPEWFLDVRDGQKDPADIARLLKVSGSGTRIFAAEIAPQVRQIEAQLPRVLAGKNRYVIIIGNTGKSAATATIALRKIPTGTYRVTAHLDGASLTKSETFSWNSRATPLFSLRNLPPKTLLTLELN